MLYAIPESDALQGELAAIEGPGVKTPGLSPAAPSGR
jgi:hypothetical protein